MLEIHRRIYTEAHHNAVRLHGMIISHGAHGAALALIHDSRQAYGYTVLYVRCRLDLTVEALVLHAEWNSIFSEDDRKAAYNRLLEYNYSFNNISWHLSKI